MNKDQARKLIGKRVSVWTAMNGEYEGTLEVVKTEPRKPWRGVVKIDRVLAKAFTQGWRNVGRKTKQVGDFIEAGGANIKEVISPITDPYHHLTYVIGDGDDFVCLDAAIRDDGQIEVNSVVNSETGGFIDRFQFDIVPLDQALSCAEAHIDKAWNWIYNNDMRLSNDDLIESENNTRTFLRHIRKLVKE
jgi:hypothetical protein